MAEIQADKPRAYSVYADDPLYVALVKERDELRAEVEWLKIKAQRSDTCWKEVLRLREALVERGFPELASDKPPSA